MAWKAGMTAHTVELRALVGHPLDGDPQWLVECRCGAFSVLLESKIDRAVERRRGRVPHLCEHCYEPRLRGKSHGLSGSPEYHAWRSAWHRCHNPRNPDFHHYGGRGIAMATEWHPPTKVGFVRFLEHIGPRPDGMSLERFDNDLGYVPGNVGRATKSEQIANRRRLTDQPKDELGRWTSTTTEAAE